jgi:hypothetical protein
MERFRGIVMLDKVSHNKVTDEGYLVSAMKFIALAPDHGINQFDLRGEESPDDRLFFVASIFHTRIPFCRDVYLNALSGRPSRGDFFSDAVKLTVPQALVGRVRDDYGLRGNNTWAMVRMGLPNVVLAMQGSEDQPRRKATLYLIPGVSPETGLAEVQEAIKDEYFGYN